LFLDVLSVPNGSGFSVSAPIPALLSRR